MPGLPHDDSRPAAMRAVVERVSEDMILAFERLRGRPIALEQASFEQALMFRPHLCRITLLDFVGAHVGFVAVATDPTSIRHALGYLDRGHASDELDDAQREALHASLGEALALLGPRPGASSLLPPRTVSAPVRLPRLPCAVRRLHTDVGPLEIALCLDDTELASTRRIQRLETRNAALQRELDTRLRLAAVDPIRVEPNTHMHLAPRREFLDRSQDLFATTHAEGRTLSLVLVDILGDGEFDASVGPAGSDLVTRRIAALCSEELAVGDLFGRLGNHEFAVTLPDRTRDQALDLAERMSKRITAARIDVYDTTIECRASLAVASTADGDDRSFRSLLRRADAALSASRGNTNHRIAAA